MWERDRAETESLYRQYGQMVLRRATQILGNQSDGEEVLQEVFATVLRKIHEFRGDATASTWLYRITTRTALQRIRRRQRRTALAARHLPRTSDAQNPRAEIYAMLRDLLARLPESLTQVAIYYYMDGMSHVEIAEVLGCSRRKVGYLLERFHEKADRIARSAPAPAERLP